MACHKEHNIIRSYHTVHLIIKKERLHVQLEYIVYQVDLLQENSVDRVAKIPEHQNR